MNEETDHLETVHRYFRLADEHSMELLDLFTDDAQIYFPKYGVGQGKHALVDILTGLGSFMASSRHDSNTYQFIAQGNHIVAEGTTSGTLLDGSSWSTGETPAGRFCNVFEFRNGLICRLHVYLDPDYAGRDAANFHWGQEGRTW